MFPEVPRLILPGEFVDPSGIVRVAPSVHPLRARELEVIQENAPRPQTLVMARGPSFFDQIHVYATHFELYPFMAPGLVEPLRAEPTTTANVIDWVSALPFESAMRFVASVQKALAFGRTDVSWQRALMYDVYGQNAISWAGEIFLRTRERGAMFSEQQLFALQRLLILNACDSDASDLTPDEHVLIRLALFYMPGTVLQAEVDLQRNAPENIDDERLLRYFVSNGSFASHGWLRHDMPRAHRLYEVIAKSPRARAHPDYCPLDSWLVERYKLSFVELQGLGFALHSGSQLLAQGSPPVAVTPSYLDSTTIADRCEHGLGALAADRAWFREQFLRSPESPRRAAFEIQPFLRRPGLRQRDGSVIVLAPRAIEGWLSPTGAYYRLLDLAREKGDPTRERFSRFNGFLEESYARQLAHMAHPYPQRRGVGVGRVYGETLYHVRKNERLTSDVIIDLGTDLVVVEVTAKRLTEKTVVDADARTIRDDLQMMIVKKMGQVGRVLCDIFDDPSRLPKLELQYVQRIWPVIVAGEGIFHAPSLWNYVNSEGGHHLDIPRSVVPAHIQPLVLLDLEELEVLMGLVTTGSSLIGILERKTSDGWRDRDLKSLLAADSHHQWPTVPFIDSELRRAMQGVIRGLGLRRNPAPSGVGDSAQQAA